MRYCLFFLLFALGSCSRSLVQPEVVCIQVKDHQGSLETFNEKERIESFKETDYLAPQPYSQILRILQEPGLDVRRSILTSYHPNGQIKQYMEGKGSIAKGPYFEWHPNGKKKIEATVVGGNFDLDYAAQKYWLFDGTSRVWDEDEQLMAEIHYDLGMLHGQTNYYHRNGALKTSMQYRKNQLHGSVCTYYPNSLLHTKTDYVKGKKQGTSIGYWENEEPSFFEQYNQDLLITAAYYNQAGSLLCSIDAGNGHRAYFAGDVLEKRVEYRQGVPEGTVVFYTPSGEVMARYGQKGDKKQGKEEVFYPTKNGEKAQVKLSVDWDDDTINGFVKTWYPNGKMQSQKEYYRNEKNGMSFAWYQDGSLMLLEEYEKDLLREGTYYKAQHGDPVSKVIDGTGTATIYDGESFTFLRKIFYVQGKPTERG